MVATASFLGNSISLQISKQGTPLTMSVPPLSAAALSHVQGSPPGKESCALTFRVDRVAEQAFILEQLQG